ANFSAVGRCRAAWRHAGSGQRSFADRELRPSEGGPLRTIPGALRGCPRHCRRATVPSAGVRPSGGLGRPGHGRLRRSRSSQEDMKVARGEIVLVDYPFSDRTGSKVRPALVVQTDALNTRIDDTILAAISRSTHRVSATQLLIDLTTAEGAATG